MRCAYPVKKKRKLNGAEFSYTHRCGQCTQCRINIRQEKTCRVQLEMNLCGHAGLFVTLSYLREKLPLKNGLPTVTREESRGFEKRLRKNTGLELRLFGSAEYGENGDNPHYHYIIWPWSLEWRPEKPWQLTKKQREEIAHAVRTRYPSWSDRKIAAWWRDLTWPEREIVRAWRGRGDVNVKEADPGTVRYVAGYALKKMGASAPDERVEKPFTVFPRRPAVGVPAVPKLVSYLKAHKFYPANRPDLKPGKDWRPIRINELSYGTRTVSNASDTALERAGGTKKSKYKQDQYWPLDDLMQREIALQYGKDERTEITKAFKPDWNESLRLFAIKEGILRLEDEISEAEASERKAMQKAAIARKGRKL